MVGVFRTKMYQTFFNQHHFLFLEENSYMNRNSNQNWSKRINFCTIWIQNVPYWAVENWNFFGTRWRVSAKAYVSTFTCLYIPPLLPFWRHIPVLHTGWPGPHPEDPLYLPSRSTSLLTYGYKKVLMLKRAVEGSGVDGNELFQQSDDPSWCSQRFYTLFCCTNNQMKGYRLYYIMKIRIE